jgi:hypothetical protein
MQTVFDDFFHLAATDFCQRGLEWRAIAKLGMCICHEPRCSGRLFKNRQGNRIQACHALGSFTDL